MNKMRPLGKFGKLAITPSYLQPPKGAVWFLHGTCDTGPGLQRWVNEVLQREFNFYSHNILFPTAPTRPYELLNGQVACVWFNRLKLSPEVPEDEVSIQKAATNLGKLIMEKTVGQGIPLSRVVLGGFSQGGTLALHLAYRLYPEVAGCFALSSFLPPDSGVYDNLDKLRQDTGGAVERKDWDKPIQHGTEESQSQFSPRNQIPQSEELSPTSSGDPDRNKLDFPEAVAEDPLGSIAVTPSIDSSVPSLSGQSRLGCKKDARLPELFMSQGTHDPLVLHSWGKSTFSRLRDYGVDGHFYTVPKLDHRIHQQQLQVLHGWIEGVLSDGPTKNSCSPLSWPPVKSHPPSYPTQS